MSNTDNLNLPYIAAAQAQKHVTHNEALRALDAIVHLSVTDKDLATPPSSPQTGSRYIVANSATGEWTGKETEIAAWQDGGWLFYPPQKGWQCWLEDENSLVIWDGTDWITKSGGANSLNPATGDLVGVNATADTTNRLSINSPASLFNHEGNDHQLKVNKNTNTDTASVLFQTGFSGRAEFGLTGDDDFHMKVSPDGSTFHEGLVIDKDDGVVSLPNGCTLPDGVKIANFGTDANAGIEIEGGGNLGQVALKIINDSSVGIAGPTFEQKSTIPDLDLVDLGFKLQNDDIGLLRLESRPTYTDTGAQPEFQIVDHTNFSTTGQIQIFRASKAGIKSEVPFQLPSYTVATLPNAATPGEGSIIYVTDETGGAIPAFSDGTNWRRLTDRGIVS